MKPSFGGTSCPKDSFVLYETSVEEVDGIVLGLKSDCSAGWDGISSKVLKCARPVLVPVIVNLFNRCIVSGVFPKALKRSIVVPIYKGGQRDCVNNYRPISILPVLSKVLEKVINKRLTHYLEGRKLLSESQYGFRSGKSTNDALHDLTDFVVNKLDSKLKCLSVFIDLAKAFDTVSLPKLLGKLENCFGIRGAPLLLFKDYLSNRTQSVKINDMLNSEKPIACGVPQGSILGPTLFLTYINELCDLALPNCKITSYADDTALTFYGPSWREVYKLA